MYKLSDCVDFVDSRLDDLFLKELGDGAWAICRAAGDAFESVTVVTGEVLKALGLTMLPEGQSLAA